MGMERNLWKWLEPVNKQLYPDLHMRRVENVAGEGDPDVEGCYKARCFNLELKSVPRPARATTRVLAPSDIRPLQIPWAKLRWAAGGSTFFFIGVGASREAKRYMIPGNLSHRIVGATEDELFAMSVIRADCSPYEVIVRACEYRQPVDPSDL